MESENLLPPASPRRRRLLPTGPVAATLALLAAIFVAGRTGAVNAAAPRAETELAVPRCVGDWVGRDTPASPAAVAMLHPVTLLQRRYENLRTGETAELLVVRCGDARDLLGHYPPVCYPAHGRELVSSSPRDFRTGSLTVTAMRYRFASRTGDGRPEIVVDDFMVLPGGRFGRDMDAVDRVARDPAARRLGAGQVQVVTSAAMTDARRDEVFDELVAPIAPRLATQVEDTR